MSGKYINRLPRSMPADQTRALSDVFQDLHRDATQYQASGSGAVIRATKDKLGEFVSVKDYGAVGDGTTDDSSAINAALGTGLCVFIPSGTYIVTGLTLSASGVTVFGEGTLKKKAGVDGVTLTVSGNDNTISGIRFDGTNSQPSATFVNDIIKITGTRNRVIGNYINGSAGGGITIASAARNIVAFNTVLNTDDNNILVADNGADDNLILGNYCSGTTQQNNIFLTASGDSSSTTNYIYRNRVIGNTCIDSADSGIESGIHTVGTIIVGNNVINSVNPGILERDSYGCIIEGNHIVAGADAATTYTGIALIEQTETSWRYKSIIKGNRIEGNLKRGGIFLNDVSDVVIEGNSIEEDTASVNSTTGSGLVGGGISFGASVNDIVVRGNKIRRLAYGVDCNWAASTPTLTRVSIEDNEMYEVGTGINMFQCTVSNCRITGNRITKVVTNALNISSCTATDSVLGRNQIVLGGYSSATPAESSFFDFSSVGFFNDEKVRRMTVPENQNTSVTIRTADAASIGIISIEFESAAETLIAAVSLSATAKLAGTSNMLDSTGSSGSSGWSLYFDGSGNLIFQRRGSNTGSGARSMRVRFDSCTNQ